MATDKAESPQTKKEYDNSFDSIQTNINFGKTSKFWQLPEELVERILLSLDADSLTIYEYGEHLYRLGSSRRISETPEVKFPPISPPVMEEDAEDLPLGCVVFHCNGIIHIFDEESATSAILFNPALKEFKFLSLPEIHEEFDEVIGCGFGYDPESNTYKYVKIFDRGEDLVDPIAVVHTLGTIYWKFITDIEVNACMFTRDNGIYCKANTHFSLLEWKGSVALFHNVVEHPGFYDLWVIEHCADWIKRLRVGPIENLGRVLTIWKHDEILVAGDRDFRSYNMHTRKFRKLPFSGLTKYCKASAVSFFKTLVSV
uniref:F-box protein n=1 Tax=Cannabis sativa TaxID=3483 RepID=A0A803Q2V1_CANSA